MEFGIKIYGTLGNILDVYKIIRIYQVCIKRCFVHIVRIFEAKWIAKWVWGRYETSESREVNCVAREGSKKALLSTLSPFRLKLDRKNGPRMKSDWDRKEEKKKQRGSCWEGREDGEKHGKEKGRKRQREAVKKQIRKGVTWDSPIERWDRLKTGRKKSGLDFPRLLFILYFFFRLLYDIIPMPSSRRLFHAFSRSLRFSARSIDITG